jgi:hypothetical protein
MAYYDTKPYDHWTSNPTFHTFKNCVYFFCGFSTKKCITIHTCNITKHQELSMYKQTCVQPSILCQSFFHLINQPMSSSTRLKILPNARIHIPSSNDLCEYWHIPLWRVMSHERKTQPHLLYSPLWCFTCSFLIGPLFVP